MADQIIQLKNNSDNLFPTMPREEYTFDVTYAGAPGLITAVKRGGLVWLYISIGDSTVLSNAVNNETLFTLPANLRSANSSLITGHARTLGAWANATYYIVMARVESNGNVNIVGNISDLQKCRYIVLNGIYETNAN